MCNCKKNTPIRQPKSKTKTTEVKTSSGVRVIRVKG